MSSPLPPPLRRLRNRQVSVGQRSLTCFAGCDYFGLSTHPAVIRALSAAARQHGAGVSASRLTTGNHPLHLQLERDLADFFGAPTATLLPTGYTADLAAAQALADQFTHAFIDERAHNSLVDAAALLSSKTRVIAFRHRNARDLARRVRLAGRNARVLVLTDGMFAVDGALAPLPDYFAMLPPSARLLVDDAQAAGILGIHGQGSPEYWNLTQTQRRRIIHVVSLSKAFGATGGAILGSAALQKSIQTRSHTFIGGTPLAPPLAAAALAGLRLARNPVLRNRLRSNLARVRAALIHSGQAAAQPSPSPILALYPPSLAVAASLSRQFRAAGIFPNYIRYPGGPAGGYFRFSVSSSHSPGQIARFVSVLKRFPPA